MEHQELYDEICRVLTECEHPEETNLCDGEMISEMYSVLVRVQNEMFKS